MKRPSARSTPSSTGFDASCFDGVYVTGDITPPTSPGSTKRAWAGEEQDDDTSRLALPNAQEA
jgi:amidophosphoribosyltransferase